jgi:hypothetical protein
VKRHFPFSEGSKMRRCHILRFVSLGITNCESFNTTSDYRKFLEVEIGDVACYLAKMWPALVPCILQANPKISKSIEVFGVKDGSTVKRVGYTPKFSLCEPKNFK